MPDDAGLSWKQQLGQVRNRIVEMEKQREVERKLLRERNENALRERLEEDTAESLSDRFSDLRQRFDRAVRKFYPFPDLKEISAEIEELQQVLQFYQGCFEQFGQVFTPAHRTLIPKLLGDIKSLRKSLDRQLKQWQSVSELAESVRFRPRASQDDPALVEKAKAFTEHAHGMPLSIPGDYFAHEKEHFWVAETDEGVLGHVKYFPEDQVIGFALVPHEETNFVKFLRAVLYKFVAEGPLAAKPDAVRVRLSYQREVKFFTDMGFVRTDVRGPSEWIYARELG